MFNTIPFLITILFGSLFFFQGCDLFGEHEHPEIEKIACEEIVSDEWVLLGLKNEEVTSIAVDHKKDGIIYVGTAFKFNDGTDGKLYKTTDCGFTWEVLFSGGSFKTIEISPDDNSEIYAINGSILKSTDHGENWELSQKGIEPPSGTSISSFILDPKNPKIQYAGTSGRFGGGFYKSIDRGNTWFEIEGNELPENRLKAGVTSIAINQENTDEIYVGTAFVGDVLRSLDAGNTWETTTVYDTGSLVHDIEINPLESRYYAGLNKAGFYTSKDGGKKWDIVNNEYLNDTSSIVELEIDKKNQSLYAIINYSDSGQIIRKELGKSNWVNVPMPDLKNGVYYSVFKVENVHGVPYLFFGLNGIYLQKLSTDY